MSIITCKCGKEWEKKNCVVATGDYTNCEDCRTGNS